MHGKGRGKKGGEGVRKVWCKGIKAEQATLTPFISGLSGGTYVGGVVTGGIGINRRYKKISSVRPEAT